MRNKQDILKAADTLKKAGQDLPPESVFGESNSEEIKWHLEAARQLYAEAGGNSKEVKDDEVAKWLAGNPSVLSDYGL